MVRNLNKKSPDVILVSMPFVALERPSIGLGLLKSALNNADITAIVDYANINFACDVGIDSYNFVSNAASIEFLGDWIFAGAAFPAHKPNQVDYLNRVSEQYALVAESKLKLLAWTMRDAAGPFVKKLARRIVEQKPLAVGCSSTFQQHVASLALLRKIKELDPSIVTLIGGANCESIMGEVTHESFEWVDFVVSGEADHLIVPLVKEIQSYGPKVPPAKLPAGVRGPLHRLNPANGFQRIGRPLVSDMDSIPIPDYDDYFEVLKRTKLDTIIKPGLLAETARGCWWGEKKHCTFCGLNGNGMAFRSKSPENAVNDISKLSKKYKINNIAVVDNILDMRYFSSVLPQFAKMDKPFNMLFETKSNLKRQQVKQLADSGINWIQPGVESMSGKLCAQLNKGNNAWMNIQLLKWAQEYGVFIAWNFLYGLPREEDEDYRVLTDWIPFIYHLQPPADGMNAIRFDRFSMYHNFQEDFGLDLKPSWAYRFNYPLNDTELNRLAVYFEDHGANKDKRLELGPGKLTLLKQLQEWSALFYDRSRESRERNSSLVTPASNRPMLTFEDDQGKMTIRDTRPCAIKNKFEVTQTSRDLIIACDTACTPEGLRKAVSMASDDDYNASLEKLIEFKIVVLVEGCYIALPVNAVQKPLPIYENFPGGYIGQLNMTEPKNTAGVSRELLASYSIKQSS
ncbi:RiPP maturation radical SAM C-methyltransferase [bacterium]|nr:RiPP maturation radical SAM C-methyltransferase [bacterium]